MHKTVLMANMVEYHVVNFYVKKHDFFEKLFFNIKNEPRGPLTYLPLFYASRSNIYSTKRELCLRS